MKLIVMIPAYNEENSIGKVIQSIPREIAGIDAVDIIVIDDGSTDNTKQIAVESGCTEVIENHYNHGLAYSFSRGLEVSLARGADIIVNTDADFQYNQAQIPDLIAPILNGQADLVSGNRQVEKLDHMKPGKKYGNIIGSKVLSLLCGLRIKDASSGFRAFSRDAAQRLNIFSRHTYTHETLIQAVHHKFRIVEIPVDFLERQDESRLISSIFSHIFKSMSTILISTLKYKAFNLFMFFSSLFFLASLILGVRFLYFFSQGIGGHVQSLILLAILAIFGLQLFLMGIQCTLLNRNREINEEILYRLNKNNPGM